ncbi:hypothetical protein N8Y15_21490 [Enterobacter hormaechei subsp. hoffmannii]|uniref:Uncharacterized protein n=1 Tax=Enterobacter asburiae TaxID=61645 RepID=A0A8I1G0N8_ENTAS|nr:MULTISPECIES: hypothetical protein [Enterobacteriaceae]MCU3194665.1 hypothetical protein [Enterobacter hormaechei subsp. hoffmannii]MDT7152603.1 hypothetical protein [Citrobacter freundii]UTA18717.1 hypothetical protein J3S84_09310 [Enterobacter cloacae]HBS6706984.1 hypothetical protein [Klebsiella pneumoniae]MBJ6483708.1 hypothetical protein [Enterobacter hormaechei]
MSEDGFNKDDLSSTFARFTTKRRNIVSDESKLKRKKPESVKLSSATQEIGSVISSVLASTSKADVTKDKQDQYKSPIRYSWEKKGINGGSNNF